MAPKKKSQRSTPTYRRLKQFNWVRDYRFPEDLRGKGSSYKSLLFVLVSRLDKNDCCFPSLKRLTRDAGLKSHTNVSMLLSDLEQKGLIKKISRKRPGGGKTSNEIEVLFPFTDKDEAVNGDVSLNESNDSPDESGVSLSEIHITNTSNKTPDKTTKKIEQQEVGVYPSVKHFLNPPLEHEKEKQGIFSGYKFPSMFKIANIQKDFYLSDKDISQALIQCYLSESIVGYDKSVPNKLCTKTLPSEMRSSSFASRKMASTFVVDNHIQQLTKSPHVRVSLWFELARAGYPLDLYPKLKRFLPEYKLPNDQSSILHSAFQSNGQLAAPLFAMTILEWSDLIPEWEEKYPRLDIILNHSEELVTEYSRRLFSLITIMLNNPDLCGASEIWGWIPDDFIKSCYTALSSQSKC